MPPLRCEEHDRLTFKLLERMLIYVRSIGPRLVQFIAKHIYAGLRNMVPIRRLIEFEDEKLVSGIWMCQKNSSLSEHTVEPKPLCAYHRAINFQIPLS